MTIFVGLSLVLLLSLGGGLDGSYGVAESTANLDTTGIAIG